MKTRDTIDSHINMQAYVDLLRGMPSEVEDRADIIALIRQRVKICNHMLRSVDRPEFPDPDDNSLMELKKAISQVYYTVMNWVFANLARELIAKQKLKLGTTKCKNPRGEEYCEFIILKVNLQEGTVEVLTELNGVKDTKPSTTIGAPFIPQLAELLDEATVPMRYEAPPVRLPSPCKSIDTFRVTKYGWKDHRKARPTVNRERNPLKF